MPSIALSKTPIVCPQLRTVKPVRISHLMRVARQIPIAVTLLQNKERKIQKNSTKLKKPHIMAGIRPQIQSKVLFWKMVIKTIIYSRLTARKKNIQPIQMTRKIQDTENTKTPTETLLMTHILTPPLIPLMVDLTLKHTPPGRTEIPMKPPGMILLLTT